MIFKYTTYARKAAIIWRPSLLKHPEKSGFVTGISQARYDKKVQIA